MNPTPKPLSSETGSGHTNQTENIIGGKACDTTSIYGSYRPALERTMQYLVDRINELRKSMKEESGLDPVEHCLFRIKGEESMREKCRRKDLPENTHSALVEIHDAIGLRVVCAFVNDVYAVRDHIASLPGVAIVEEKDYIRHAKPNGYRSYHMILQVENHAASNENCRQIQSDTMAEPARKPSDPMSDTPPLQHFYAEIQLRTISQDTWAALEHHLKYKKQIGGNQELIIEELKRCADELASTDISMQTLKDMIMMETME